MANDERATVYDAIKAARGKSAAPPGTETAFIASRPTTTGAAGSPLVESATGRLYGWADGTGGAVAATPAAPPLFDGYEFSSLASTTGWSTSTTGGSIIATTLSDGNAGLQLAVDSSSSTVYLTWSATDAGILYDRSTVLGIWCEIADPGRTTLQILVSNETGQTFTNWATLTIPQTGGTTFKGGLYFYSSCIADAANSGGNFAAAGKISSIRVRAAQPYNSQGGSMKIRSLMVGALNRPKISFTFDDCYATAFTEGVRYMAKYGMVGNLAVNSANIGSTATYMTLAQLQAAYAMGWNAIGHTPSHVAFNSNSTNSIATAQTPGAAGNLTLDGAVGTAAFDAPRHVIVRAAADQGRKLTITGLDVNGAALSEDLYTWTASTPVPTQNLFTQVTQIAVDAASSGTITVGTSLSPAQMYSAITTVRDYLIAKGMPRGAYDFAHPQGEMNPTSQALLAQLGFRCARIVNGQRAAPQMGDVRPYEICGFGGGGSAVTAATLIGYVDIAIREGRNTTIYLHELVQSGSPTSTQTLVSEFRAFIDTLAEYQARGMCDIVPLYGVLS